MSNATILPSTERPKTPRESPTHAVVRIFFCRMVTVADAPENAQSMEEFFSPSSVLTNASVRALLSGRWEIFSPRMIARCCATKLATR